MYAILNILISKKYESAFLARLDQRKILCQLARNSMSYDEMFDTNDNSICLCNEQICVALTKAIPHFANVFLSNYSKNVNDAICASSATNTSRKLKTLLH
jgi:hypothetical protein